MEQERSFLHRQLREISGAKAERRAQLEAAYRNQRERIEQLEAFINRFRYQATKAKQVQSRIKELEQIERIEIPPEEKAIHFSFPQPKPSGRIVAEFKDVSKSYGTEARLLRAELRHRARRSHRAGRREWRGQIHADQAARRHRAARPPGDTSWATTSMPTTSPRISTRSSTPRRACWTICPSRPALHPDRAAQPAWLFPVYRRRRVQAIGVLSGGERNRYALARMLLTPSNFLLLDEPTNHLDMRAKDVLLESLQKFTGTVVFVSHDRYFIDKLATRVFEIGEGHVDVFPGNYEDYLWRKEGRRRAAGCFTHVASAHVSASAAIATNHDEPAKSTEPEAKQKRLNPIKLKQMKERLHELEEEIARFEAAIATAETALQNFVSVEETQRQTDLLNRSKSDLEQAMNEWEELGQALEAQAEA